MPDRDQHCDVESDETYDDSSEEHRSNEVVGPTSRDAPISPQIAMLRRLLQFMSPSTDITTSPTKGETTMTEVSNMSPESMLKEATDHFTKMLDAFSKIPELANQEIPTATIPSDLSTANRPVTTAPIYKSIDNLRDSGKDILNMAKDAFSIIDTMSKHLSDPPTTSPETSSAPAPSRFRTIMEAISESVLPNTATSNNASPQGLPPRRNNLASSTLNSVTRLYQTDELTIRTNIILLHNHLLTVPEDDSSYPFIQSTICLSLLHLYEVTWDNNMLEAGCDGSAIALQTLFQLPELQRVKSAPTVVRCWAFGQRLFVRKYGDVDKLETALGVLTSTWNIYKDLPGIPDRVKEFLRTELGMCYADHYRCTGELDSLNNAIDHLLALTEEEETSSPATVVLGLAYYDRFLHCGALDDLDRALRRGQLGCGVMNLENPSASGLIIDTSAGHHLFSLALAERFKMTMDIQDLDKAVEHCIKAMELLHPSHPFRVPYSVDLANVLYTRHVALGEGSRDLHTALECIQSAIVTTKDDIGVHSRIPAGATIGFLVAMDAEEKRNASSIETGISYIQKSRKSFSGPPYLESRIEHYLSSAILGRFRLGRNKDDFELAIHHAQLAYNKAPSNSPYRFQRGLDIGRLLFEQYECDKSGQCDDAIAQFISVAMSETWPIIRLQAAIAWANAAEASHSDGAEDALKLALEILPTLASLSNLIPAQYRFLSSQKASIANRAAIYALDAGDMVGAISRLEQGRNIMWAQSLQLRAGHMLPAGDEREREFKLLSRHLSETRHEPVGSRTLEEMEEFLKHVPPNFAAAGINESVANELGGIMKKIIELLGHSQVDRGLEISNESKQEFMRTYMDASLHSSVNRWITLHTELQALTDTTIAFSESVKEDLRPILEKGSIVVISSYALRCDVIVISGSEGKDLHFHHLPLPELSGDKIQTWAETLRIGTHHFEERKIQLEEFENERLNPILRGLWSGLALPLLDYLNDIGAKKRVWWYPTGSMMFLPVHAASTCNEDEPGLLDILVSSYIPSLQSLIRASKAPPLPVKVLAVGLPNTPGLVPLKYVDKEIRTLRKLFYSIPDNLTTLVGDEADIYPVISKLPEHTCVHLSCHAYQDEEYPFNSALFLHNGKLKLSKLMTLDLSRVQLAFLSACLTSAGDANLPDECIHLAAAMQFAGVGSVIGTMWSVMDREAATAASKVYSYLFRNGVENADMAEGAEALHEAIADMRRRRLPLTYIVPFIHLGL